jgi:hypothetical protein
MIGISVPRSLQGPALPRQVKLWTAGHVWSWLTAWHVGQKIADVLMKAGVDGITLQDLVRGALGGGGRDKRGGDESSGVGMPVSTLMRLGRVSMGK